MSDNRTVHQPLHPSVLDLIDPEYRKFHEEFLQYKVPSQSVPWSPSARDGPLMPGNNEPVPVGEVKRLKFRQCTALCWIPQGEAPKDGWGVLVYYHGGGVRYSIMKTALSHRDTVDPVETGRRGCFLHESLCEYAHYHCLRSYHLTMAQIHLVSSSRSPID